ncbi:MAG TPA: Rrf2 family transcriptional regulator [Candidatus Competibacteraceae bacterium]|nr:Rrf2 family transcriptional regulator [Candidatus Competibacteraceae bacterium]MCP5132201.1 Rrf2 family transcriptional regulator [Gammaproteobacteria bacterium]HPF59601.1 Rrf2 family transcriptional regulator [Candidatus Competibacteraceae bacterium]HRY18320.1 Rrf2 family transcriptional regulator [Candidatus Competibacteraceae bacterium]
MKLSTKGRYAVTAMMHLAIHDRHGPVTLAEISQCQGISLSYLEQLFAKLRKHGLVEGVRGPGGGYRLARMPDQVTVANIITAVDERLDATRCCGDENCQGGRRCLTHQLWTDLSRQIFTFLEGITLAQFVERPAIGDTAHRHHTRRRDRIQPIQFPAMV